jgi:hypothetical protein
MYTSTLLTTIALATLTLAKTDLEGCTSSQTVAYGGASMIYWVPGTGEICSFLDCGGGRAPPKTTVPGCDGYVGTATYSPEYMSFAGAAETGAASASGSVEASPTAGAESVEASVTSTRGGEGLPLQTETDIASASETEYSLSGLPSIAVPTITNTPGLPIVTPPVKSATITTKPSGVAMSSGFVPGHSGNVTGSAAKPTLSSTGVPPESTGAASGLEIAAKGVVGLVVGVVGLALL